MSPLSPKIRFRLNRWRNRWEAWRAQARQTGQAVLAEQKMCPNCRALVSRGDSRCPYCEQRLRVVGSGPAGKVAGRILPEGMQVTAILVLVNALFFLAEYAIGGTSILSAGLLGGPSQTATVRLGESLPLPYIIHYGQFGRWFTAQFLHANLVHIGMNMWVLFDVGPLCESLYGHAKYLVMYLIAGAVGYFASSFFGYASLGASGAILGLVGVLAGYGTRNSHTSNGRLIRSHAVRYVVYVLIFAVGLNHFGGGIDNAAHLGGFAAGFVLGFLLRDGEARTEGEARFWHAAAWVMVIVVAASFVSVLTHPLS